MLSAPATVLLLAITVSADNPDFQACAESVGDKYIAARNRYLKGDVDVEMLKSKQGGKDWRQRVTAAALLGWHRHADYYETLTKAPTILDRRGRRQYRWARSPRELDVSAVPLMYELLFKQAQGESARDAAEALVALASKGARIDNDLLLAALTEPDTAKLTRRAAAFALSNLPDDAFTLPPKRLLEVASKEQDPEVTASLVSGVVRHRARIMDKDELVGMIVADTRIGTQLGETQVVRAAGEIGGARGAEVTMKFLQSTNSVAEQRWAVSALSRSQTEVGKQAVLNYAQAEKVPASVRLAAIQGLSQVAYDTDVGATLRNIALEPKRAPGDRVEAVRVLATLLRENRDAPIADELRKTLNQVDEADIEDSTLDAQIQKAIRQSDE